eukprot:CAMPEP_0181478654 /NCGR_PEP_ID=MMETSP1110-20121109/42859_1 /TAXON_ID=174948 /ORGANISM="Symbiodinium sp., Strain CCMP421" /LENGTH=41 /DNA_ID= /DNA_START= /DNA_END= /DNA_ORIENTATION=
MASGAVGIEDSLSGPSISQLCLQQCLGFMSTSLWKQWDRVA